MEKISSVLFPAKPSPVRILQFGEGNFLRAFVDYMVDILNEKSGFNGSIVIVKPIPFGNLEHFHDQDCRYTVLLRGIQDGNRVELSRCITSVSDAIDCYSMYDIYASYAKLDTLRFIVSNTTEAGIVLDPEDRFDARPPHSYPGKLTKFLFERAVHFQFDPSKGLIILPVELIDDNGGMLKKCVLELSRIWGLGERFIDWLNNSCVFTSTLVDRIVTGFPKDEYETLWESLGYEDQLLDTAEPFGLWVIESPSDISAELPFPVCGLPVIYTDNQKPYKQRKVRILNGAHTSFVPAAFLMGYDYVLDAMNDPLIAEFVSDTLQQEVIPTLTLPKEDLLSFAESVTQRFRNPYIKHSLLSICLNSVSKWRARCLPSLLTYYKTTGRLPERLTFSLAALLSLYHGGILVDGKLQKERQGMAYSLMDDSAVLNFFNDNIHASPENFVPVFVSNELFFGPDLKNVPEITDYVLSYFLEIRDSGIRNVMQKHFGR